MSERASRAVGTKLEIGLGMIGDLTSIGSPSVTKEELDTTTLDNTDGYRTFIPGFKDGGEVPVSGYLVTSDQGQVKLLEALENDDELYDFNIIYPAKIGASWSFKAYVSAYNITSEVEDAIGFEATLRVSGKPSLNFGPSSGLTDLVLAGTGGALSPNFDTGTNFYAFGGVTDDSFTVTATAANHALRLYIDGQFQEELESGQASSAIPFEAVESRKVTIVAHEHGKIPVVYEVVVTAAP